MKQIKTRGGVINWKYCNTRGRRIPPKEGVCVSIITVANQDHCSSFYVVISVITAAVIFLVSVRIIKHVGEMIKVLRQDLGKTCRN